MDRLHENITLAEAMNIIDEYLTEAESDHKMHMDIKKQYADYFDKDVNDLPNKKYKNDESAKKADLKYKYKESDKKLKSGYTEHPYSSKEGPHQNFTHYTNKDPKKIDSELTRMIGKYVDDKSESGKKKLEYARKKILQRVGEDPDNTELFSKNYKGGREINITDAEGKNHKHVTKDDIHISTNKSTPAHDIKKLSDEYALIHNTNNKFIHNLKGSNKSTRFTGNNEMTAAGQLHPEKRSYYTIVKKSEAHKGNGRLGNYNYKLTDKDVKDFHFDPEEGYNKAYQRYGPKGDVSGKDVYLTGDKHKVKNASKLKFKFPKFKKDKD